VTQNLLGAGSEHSREVEFALPEELNRSEAIALAREFVEREFVARGMVADVNVHWDQRNPHAHVMLTMRELTRDGFGLKVTEWNRRELLGEWREHWADLANEHLLRSGLDIRIDHRSYKDEASDWSRPAIWAGRSTRCVLVASNRSDSANWSKSANATPGGLNSAPRSSSTI
jgi:ATP-dependent exoDNAse (exonuclease V) alpha subunit